MNYKIIYFAILKKILYGLYFLEQFQNYWEILEASKESFHMPPYPVSPVINNWHLHGTFVTTNEMILIHC